MNAFLQHSEGSSLICNGDLIGTLSTAPSCGAVNGTAVFQNLINSSNWLINNGIRTSSGIRSSCMKPFTFVIILIVWII